MARLEGKVAIVTGGNSGIGKKTIEVFLKEGAKVVFCSRREDKNEESLNEFSAWGEVSYVTADLKKSEDCKKVVDYTLAKYGRVDILVNNAGIADKHIRITRCSDEWYDEVVKINQYSVFYMCKYVLPGMMENKSGSIINISSIGGKGVAGISYSASKAAVDSMTKNIAIEIGGSGVRCNAVAPGPTPTPLNAPEKIKTFDQEFAAKTANHMDFSVGECDVSDQANAILFFASDESKRISGQILYVDNGATLFE